jgi:hypothetical protein
MYRRCSIPANSIQARSADGVTIVDDFGSIGMISVIDYLGRTPGTATTKIRLSDEMVSEQPLSRDELSQRLDLGRPKVPFETAKIYAHQDSLHAPGKHVPWKAHLTNLNAAHEEHDRQSRNNPVTVPSRNIFRVLDQSSWTYRQMINRSTAQRQKHLREWEKRDNALTGRYPGHQLPREVPEHYAVDALLEYDRSKTHRGVALPTKSKPRDEVTRQLQLKMRRLIHNFISENPKEHGAVAATFPEKVRFDFHAKINKVDPYVDYNNAGAAEEFDILDFSRPDELEYVFDAPNVAVGAYDRDEVDYYVHQEINEELKAMKKDGFSDNDVRNVLASNSGCDEQELEERLEEAKARLVKKRKLLPLPVAKGKQVTVKVVTVKQVAARRASPSDHPSLRSRVPTEAEPMWELMREGAGEPSPEPAEANGESSRSGRAVKKPAGESIIDH